ncbi:MAG: thiol:disulfide interchange protein DsbA/DsbL [Gammaproteobacteria bacterium]|nr:MAG: thiol:disulfide interchange protein DsbA/DsbL [Gammaproteobacteria bacterium]
MKRLTLLLASLMLAGLAQAQFLYKEGQHYAPLPVPVPTVDASKVEVAEVFAYGCIHCYHFEPLLAEWKKTLPAEAVFVSVPAVFGREDMMLQAQAFYTAEALGVMEKTHPAMFAVIHEQKQQLDSEQSLADLFKSAAGVDPAEFSKVFNSFGIASRARQSMNRMRDYRVTGTPTVIINGKWVINGRNLSGQAEVLKVADFLIARETQALRAKAAADKALSAIPAGEAAPEAVSE